MAKGYATAGERQGLVDISPLIEDPDLAVQLSTCINDVMHLVNADSMVGERSDEYGYVLHEVPLTYMEDVVVEETFWRPISVYVKRYDCGQIGIGISLKPSACRLLDKGLPFRDVSVVIKPVDIDAFQIEMAGDFSVGLSQYKTGEDFIHSGNEAIPYVLSVFPQVEALYGGQPCVATLCDC